MFITLTNEGWFPDSSEFDHMWQASVLRAIETRTPIVRVANTGYSGSIDPNGVTVLRISENQGGQAGTSFHVQVPQYDRTTLYEWLGDWLGNLGLIVGLAALVAVWLPAARRREHAAPTT